MKKLLLLVGLITVFSSANASAMGLLDCWSDRGFNQNFMVSTQMEDGYFRCDASRGQDLFLSFDGVGVGIGIGLEAFKMLYLGPGLPIGEFYGLRVEAAGVVGVNLMTLVGAKGFIQVFGVDLGVGADISAVKVTISESSSEVRRGK